MELTTEMMLVMAMIGIAIFLFIVEWIRVDVVAILMMVTLPLLGLVTPTEAFIGLSSNAVVSIIAVIIIGAGLDKTGLVNKVVAPVVKLAGDSQNKVVIFISMTVAVISSFMQNIGAAALFLPAIRRISKTMKVSISRMLMPIGFCAILGGTITMVGSSPLILMNDLIAPYELEPFSLFAVTPIGLALVVSGIAYFTLFGSFILPKYDLEGENGDDDSSRSKDNIKSWYRFLGEPWELSVPENYIPHDDVKTISQVRKKYLVNIVAVAGPDGKKILTPSRSTPLQGGCELAAYGTEENINRFAKDHGLTVKKSITTFEDLLHPSMSGTVEAVVAPRSNLVGKSLGEVHFRRIFGIAPLAIYRGDKVFKTGLSQLTLQTGDAVLFHGSWENFKIVQTNPDFIFTTQIDVETLRPEKAAMAGTALAIALSMVMLFNIQLSVALMTGALIIILTRVLTIDEAYQSVDWRTVFLLAGLIPLGIATEKSGTAAWIAHQTLSMLGDVSPVVMLSIIAILSTGFTLVISNVGATVLLVPLVVNMAMSAGVDPRMAALTVGIAVSNSFILPTHQVNALYMGPGRYRSVDFLKAGSIISIIFLVVMISVMYLLYDIGAPPAAEDALLVHAQTASS